MTDVPEPTTEPEAPATPQKPLRLVGLGLLIIMLIPDFRGYDVLPNWIGWLLVLAGSARLTHGLPSRAPVLWAAGLAAVSAFAIWPPPWESVILDQEKGILWAILLPQVIWSVLFALAMAGFARRDPGAAIWWKYLALISVAVGVLPVIVYGGGVRSLESTLATLNVLALVAAMVLAFWHSSRPWAVIEPPVTTAE